VNLDNWIVRQYTSPEPGVTIGADSPTAVALSSFTARTDDFPSNALLALGLAVSGALAVSAGWWLMRRR
jgi:LPXTG-motif cell wall-anchored protein